MDIKEIRIGNIVQIDNPMAYLDLLGIPMIVNKIQYNRTKEEAYLSLERVVKHEYGSLEYHQLMGYIKPFKMTRQFAELLGFDVLINRTPKGLNNTMIISLNGVELFSKVNKPFRFYFNFGNEEVEIRYVHQLQNLYFALKNEEINIII